MCGLMPEEAGLQFLLIIRLKAISAEYIKAIFTDRLAEAVSKELKGTSFENNPLIGIFSQIRGLFSDEKESHGQIMSLYGYHNQHS